MLILYTLHDQIRLTYPGTCCASLCSLDFKLSRKIIESVYSNVDQQLETNGLTGSPIAVTLRSASGFAPAVWKKYRTYKPQYLFVYRQQHKKQGLHYHKQIATLNKVVTTNSDFANIHGIVPFFVRTGTSAKSVKFVCIFKFG